METFCKFLLQKSKLCCFQRVNVKLYLLFALSMFLISPTVSLSGIKSALVDKHYALCTWTMILLICIFPLRHGYSLYPVCKQFRSRSDYTYTQADLDLHWSSTWWKGYSLYPMCKQCRSDKTTQMCRLIVIYVSCALDNRCTMRERIFSLVRVINR